MKTAQVVALMVGVAFTLTSASVSLINMMTSSGSQVPTGFRPNDGQTTLICYWVVGLLFFCLAGVLNRIHRPIATALGIPAILLMLTGGIGSYLFFFFLQSPMLPITLNFASSLLFLAAIFLIYKFDKLENVTPIYKTNPTPMANPAVGTMHTTTPVTMQEPTTTPVANPLPGSQGTIQQ